jgi:hypothetical protein
VNGSCTECSDHMNCYGGDQQEQIVIEPGWYPFPDQDFPDYVLQVIKRAGGINLQLSYFTHFIISAQLRHLVSQRAIQIVHTRMSVRRVMRIAFVANVPKTTIAEVLFVAFK